MQPVAAGGERRSLSRLEQLDEEARVAYGALRDEEIDDLVAREPEYYVPRLHALGLKWPR